MIVALMHIHTLTTCCVEKMYRASRHVTIIIAQQPVQAIATSDLATVAPKVRLRCNAPVGETLMIPLGVIVVQVLLDRIIQGPFTQYHHLTQGLLLDGAYKPFAIGIEVWTPRG